MTVARTGTPGPMPPSERYSTGKPVGCEGEAEGGHALLRGAARGAGHADPGHVALHVGGHHGTPAAESCSAIV